MKHYRGIQISNRHKEEWVHVSDTDESSAKATLIACYGSLPNDIDQADDWHVAPVYGRSYEAEFCLMVQATLSYMDGRNWRVVWTGYDYRAWVGGEMVHAGKIVLLNAIKEIHAINKKATRVTQGQRIDGILSVIERFTLETPSASLFGNIVPTLYKIKAKLEEVV